MTTLTTRFPTFARMITCSVIWASLLMGQTKAKLMTAGSVDRPSLEDNSMEREKPFEDDPLLAASEDTSYNDNGYFVEHEGYNLEFQGPSMQVGLPGGSNIAHVEVGSASPRVMLRPAGLALAEKDGRVFHRRTRIPYGVGVRLPSISTNRAFARLEESSPWKYSAKSSGPTKHGSRRHGFAAWHFGGHNGCPKCCTWPASWKTSCRAYFNCFSC